MHCYFYLWVLTRLFSKPNKEGGYGRQLLLCQTFLFKSGFYCDGFERIDGCFGRAISLYSQGQLNQPPTLWLSDMYWLLNSWAINVRQLPSAQIQLRIPSLMTNEKSFANFGNSALNQSPTYCRERNISIPVIEYVCMYKNQGFWIYVWKHRFIMIHSHCSK